MPSRQLVTFKIVFSCIFALVLIILGLGLGTVIINPLDTISILTHYLTGQTQSATIDTIASSIILDLRLPRVLLAFLAGASLAISGAVMQSSLKNHLASSYTLGVSSGAALGAAAFFIWSRSIPLLQTIGLPISGLICGLITVFIILFFANSIDSKMENLTVILSGIIFSLFINAIMGLLLQFANDNVLRALNDWQMGSFAGHPLHYSFILFIAFIISFFILMRKSMEMDILSFGEETAKSLGVDVRKTKWFVLGTSAALTGVAISFVGIIGFIDLITPHLVRRLFGARHQLVLPMSAVIGGGFMVFADLISRTILAPHEIAVGVITALIGAPLFAAVYFLTGREK